MHTLFAILLTGAVITVTAQDSLQFESLGVPVTKAGLMGVLVGPGPAENSERIYFNFRQDGGKLFLVAVNPDTGESQQFQSPVGTGAWGFIVGPDNKIYLGTHEGPDPGDSGQILVFDPKQPEKQIQVVGRPSETETYLWMFATGEDGLIYGCTYPTAKLVSFNPATGEMQDLGIMDDSQMYTRSICPGPGGTIVIGVGYGRANAVLYDPATGEHQGILPDEYRSDPAQTVASVWQGVDGNAYISATRMEVLNGDPENGEIKRPVSVTLRVNDDRSVEEVANPPTTVDRLTLRDGRRVNNPTIDGTFELVHSDGTVEAHTFEYAGAGSGIFMVANGPLGRIYGGTAMPNELFWYDPATGALENPGNPTETSGEIYSMLDHHGALYVCAYPGAFLSKWDPAQPWNYGREATSNPRGLGPLGPGHLRPRAMIHGPNEHLYIGSYPEYGKHGGSLGVWDPAQDRLIENYHNLIRNQSIVSLAYDPETQLVFGGSSVQGGGGTEPVEPEAKFFAFDTKMKRLAFEEVPHPGSSAIRTLLRLDRRIVGVSGGDDLFVYDIDRRAFVHRSKLGVGHVLDCSLAQGSDGQIYGLSSKQVFRIDPATYEVSILAEYPDGIHCGFAMDDRGIYFGHRAELLRYNWPEE